MVIASACLILVVVWVLLAYVSIPLPVSDPFFAWVHRQWLGEGVAMLACLGTVGAVWYEQRRDARPATTWWPAWLLWIAWGTLSLVYSIDRGASLRSLLVFTSYGLLAYVSRSVIRDRNALRLWVTFLVLAALVTVLDGFMQYVRSFTATLPVLKQFQAAGELDLQGWGGQVIEDFLIRKRIFSVFGWPTLFAGFLILMIPLAIGLTLQARRRLTRWGWIVACGALGLSLILTLSVVGWIAAVLTASIVWALSRRAPETTRRVSWALPRALAAGLITSGVLLVTSFIVAQRARGMILGSAKSRFVYVHTAWVILQTHPWIGTGLGTFGLAYWSLMPSQYGGDAHSAIHAHNTVMEVAAEGGLIGLACFLVLLWRLGRLVGPAVRALTLRGPPRLEGWLAVGVLGFFLHSLLEQTFVEAITAPFWWIVLGLLTGASSSQRSMVSSRWHLALPLITACLGLMVVPRWALADGWAARGAWLDLSGHRDQARAAFEQAQRYDPLTSRYPLEQGERFLKYAAAQPSHETHSLVRQAQEAYERTVKLSPWLGYAWLRLGEVRWQLGQRDAAIEAMETAVKRDPNSRAAVSNLAHMVRTTGRFKELIEAGRAFQRLEPTNPLGYFWEALGWEYVGTSEQTEQAYRRLLARFPDYDRALFNLATLLRQRGALAQAVDYYSRFLQVAPTTQPSARQEAEEFLRALHTEGPASQLPP